LPNAVQQGHEDQALDDPVRMVGDDDGRTPSRNSLEVAVVQLETDIERLEQAAGESRPGSTLPGVLETVHHLGWNQELVQGGCQRLRPGGAASGGESAARITESAARRCALSDIGSRSVTPW